MSNKNGQNLGFLFIIAVLLLNACFAPQDAAQEPNTLQVPEQYATIQAAINAARSGDLILVAPGTYDQNLNILGKTITLASQFHTSGDESIIERTVINGRIAIDNNAAGTEIVGFTIQNGEDGIKPYSPIVVRHNVIRWTTDGIDFEGGVGSIVTDNIFEENYDDGIDLDEATAAEIRRNIIRNNESDGMEMRIHHYDGDEPLQIVIADNLIIGNGDDGLQIIDDLADGETTNRIYTIKNNVIAHNGAAGLGFLDNGDTVQDFRAARAPDPVHFYNNTVVGNDHGISGSATDLVVLNNIFAGHANIALKKVSGGPIAAYNLFWSNGSDFEESDVDLATSLFTNPLLTNDYALSPQSPALRQGIPMFEWNGDTIFDLPEGDIGAAPDLGKLAD